MAVMSSISAVTGVLSVLPVLLLSGRRRSSCACGQCGPDSLARRRTRSSRVCEFGR